MSKTRKIVLYFMICQTCVFLLFAIIDLGLVVFNTISGFPESLSDCSISIPTPISGQNQPTHPTVVSFESPWNGYKYWMSYTPHPYSNGFEEDPCIAVSNDLIYWEVPSGFVNPLADNSETECDEYKDPHLVFRSDLNRLECWYLGRIGPRLGGDDNALILFRKYSYNGIDWSDYEIMNSSFQWLSQSIIWDEIERIYKVWAIGYDLFGNRGVFVYLESDDGYSWTNPINCEVGNRSENIDMWHAGVSYYNNQYHCVFVPYDKEKILYCSSNDGIVFSQPTACVLNDRTKYAYLYRPFLLFEGEQWNLFYGIINYKDEWSVSFSSGKDVAELKGLRATYLPNSSINHYVYNGSDLKTNLLLIYHECQHSFSLVIIVLLVTEVFILLIFQKRVRKRIDNIILVSFFFINIVSSVFLCMRRTDSKSTYLFVGVICFSFLLAFVSNAALYGIFELKNGMDGDIKKSNHELKKELE